MITVLRSRTVRQILPNSNLAFFRCNADDNNKDTTDPKAVAREILHSDHCQEIPDQKEELSNVNPQVIDQHIVAEYPEEPTTCCMSGCANCVWLDYAEKISAYYADGGEKAIKDINEKVNDANIKAFLLQELRMRKS